MNLDKALFELAYSDFLEQREYDEAEGYLFSIVRSAFAAGWKAAGGQLPGLRQTYNVSLSYGYDEPPAKS